MTPKPVKPVRCYAIVNAKGGTVAVYKLRPLREWLDDDERILPGRFVPDAPTKARKGKG